jgi:cytochrome c551/c552
MRPATLRLLGALSLTALGGLGASSCAAKPEDPTLAQVVGNPVRGRELMEHFECSRCHQGAGLAAAAPEKQCMPCHQAILDGKTPGPTREIDARWRERIAGLNEAPSLDGTGERFRRRWIVDFLEKPHDLRPLLISTMPRLPVTDADARDIAAYLVPREDPVRERAEDDALLEEGDAEQGRALLTSKGCGSCHWMTGVPSFTGQPSAVYVADPSRAMTLAPDLRYTRDRMTAAKVVRWIKSPKDVKADTLMPTTPLTPVEIKNIATYILRAPLAPLPRREMPRALPPLDRPVLYAEVRDKVFQRTCWHCHSDPDLDRGDVGPGNVGGFGFEPRHLDLATYEGIFAGTVDKDGQRHSIFAPMPDGTPRVVAALLARHREELGDVDPALRGMPLGLPSLPMEDIQLVTTWIAQGRRR